MILEPGTCTPNRGEALPPWLLRRLHPRLFSAFEVFRAPGSSWKGLWVESFESQPMDWAQVAYFLSQGSGCPIPVRIFQPSTPLPVEALDALGQDLSRQLWVLPLAVDSDWSGRWFLSETGQLSFQCGIVHEARGGMVLAPLSTCLTERSGLQSALGVLHRGREDWQSLSEIWSRRGCPAPFLKPVELPQQWIVVGQAWEWSQWSRAWPLAAHAAWMKVHLENSFKAESEEEVEAWEAYLQGFLSFACPELPTEKIRRMNWVGWGRAKAQSHQKLPLHFSDAVALLKRETALAALAKPSLHWSALWRQARFEQGVVDESAQESFHLGDVMLELTGRRVGQLCGLSVSQDSTSDFAFGIPFRITCKAYSGEGDLVDVDGKVGLGGHLHQKGLSILQAYLRSLVQWEQPWPMNASIVSEQTYDYFDGDSASLAEFCCWLSALADVPLQQGLAVTGSMNQCGEVQVVGGVLEKILGFWSLCQSRGFPKGCGVILPWNNAKEVVLPPKILASAQSGAFQMIPVKYAMQALFHLTGCSESALKAKLRERFEARQHQENSGRGRWSSEPKLGWRKWLDWPWRWGAR